MPVTALWVILPRWTDYDVAGMDMRRLRNDEADGVGHIIIGWLPEAFGGRSKKLIQCRTIGSIARQSAKCPPQLFFKNTQFFRIPGVANYTP